jgi:hypothetical protein
MPWLGVRSLREFALQIEHHPLIETAPSSKLREVSALERESIARISTSFHERANTLTEAVQENLARYKAGADCVRAAHQPNFLPATNIVGQAALIHRLTRQLGRGYSEVFFLIDYDLNTDRRYRHASLPSVSARTGLRTFSAPPLGGSPPSLMYLEPPPSEQFITEVCSRLHDWVYQDAYQLRRTVPGLALQSSVRKAKETIEELLVHSAKAAESLADFNAILLSQMVNRILGLPTLFLPGSRLLSVMADPIVSVWNSRAEISTAASKARRILNDLGLPTGSPVQDMVPLWLICPCGNRIPIVGSSRRKSYMAECKRCRRVNKIDDRSIFDHAKKSRIVPKVLADDLLDGLAWGNIAGCDYVGGIGHYVQSSLVADILGLRRLPVYLSARATTARAQSLAGPAFSAALSDSTSTPRLSDRLFDTLLSGRASFVFPLIWHSNISPDDLADDFHPVEMSVIQSNNETGGEGKHG